MKSDFNHKCYEILKKVPAGKVTTYKEIAKALNSSAFRAVGNAMKKNQNTIKIPCHRVVKSNGEVGGFVYGTKNKIRLLKKEGIEVKKGKVNLEKYLYKFS